jgi:hypothetical protein
MRKNKLLLLLALLMTAATGAWADNTVRWEKYQISEFNLMQGDRETIDDVTITCKGGSVSNNGGDISFNGQFTFSVPVGSVLTQIVIVDETWLGVDVNNTGWSVDESLTQATWTGSARSVACEITTSNAQYIEFTIASAVPKMYTSEVSITDLVPGDTLAEGATIIGSGSEDDMVYLAFGRTKKNGVVPSFWTNLGLPPTVIGTNGTISGTYTPVDGNGQDGNAWVVTDAQLNDYDGFEVGLGGIILPEQPQLYTVTLADGGKDTQNWTITPAEATTTGVTEGQTVTLKYNGRLKVKGVKATSDAAPAGAKAAKDATAEDLGKVIGADGNIYDNADAATAAGTTASAIIAYVGTAGSVDESSSTYKGLAIALTDANSGDACQWYTANSGTCVSQTNANATAITYMDGIASTNTLTSDGHTHAAADAARNYSTARPSDVSAWFLPSMGQWNLIVQGLATKQAGSTVSTNLTGSTNDTYKADNLNTVITAAGGTGFQSNRYQSSTEYGTNRVWNMAFNGGNAASGIKSNVYYVRAVFAF